MSAEGALSRETLVQFLRERRLAVIATATPDGRPEAALINIAVTPDLDIVFETTSVTRKYSNLKRNPSVSLVVGWAGEKTLQLDGVAEELEAETYEKLTPFFFYAFPEKRSHEYWPGNCYFRIRPYWFRLSDYNFPRKVEELDLPRPPQPGTQRRRGWFGGP